MKLFKSLLVITTTLALASCSVESYDGNLETITADSKFALNDEICFSTELIAGQNYVAGDLNVSLSGDNLIITYTTSGDWTIDATHLSIGNCNDGSIPLTGSGNPKIGKFEYSSEHEVGVTEVVYVIDASTLSDHYCFAAHAEVSGPEGGETAWASGNDFDGNSWAMFVEANLSDCDNEVSDDEEEEDQDEEEEQERF